MGNRATRKSDYASMADASSRNQKALDGPAHHDKERAVAKSPEMFVQGVSQAKRATVQEIKVATNSNHEQARRQTAAWKRCGFAVKNGNHDFSGKREGHPGTTYPSSNCITCGCPKQ